MQRTPSRTFGLAQGESLGTWHPEAPTSGWTATSTPITWQVLNSPISILKPFSLPESPRGITAEWWSYTQHRGRHSAARPHKTVEVLLRLRVMQLCGLLSILAGAQVPPNYDSLLGKLIVWGEDRTQAIARMKRALNELVISGVPTTTQYHEMILEIDDFVNGNVDTGFIPKHADQLTDPPPPKSSVSANPSCASHAWLCPRCIARPVGSPQVLQ